MTALPGVWETMAQVVLGMWALRVVASLWVGAARLPLVSSSCLFSIPPLLLHSIHFIVSFFSGCQAPGPASPMGTRTTPTDARTQGCGAAVPAKPRVPSVRVLSCVGDLRSGKQKLHVSTGWGGKATSLQASVAGR